MGIRRVAVRERLAADEIAQVMAVVNAATEHDGVRPLNEHVMLHLRYGGEAAAHNLLLFVGKDLAGYAFMDPTDPVEGPSGELVVHPAHRGHGNGRALVTAVLAESGGRLRLWAHGELPAAAALAASLGFERSRGLWQMRRSLYARLPDPVLPDGLRLRTFEVGRDEEEWTALNHRAFARHPEQGAWTLDDLRRREQESWFDPDGFFIAERDGQMAGFHWTKVHGGDGSGGHGHDPIGEVYVVGVDPAERGGGLGKALTLVGLRHLRRLGLAQVMLYVDETNVAAIKLYQALGFTHWDTDVMYRR